MKKFALWNWNWLKPNVCIFVHANFIAYYSEKGYYTRLIELNVTYKLKQNYELYQSTSRFILYFHIGTFMSMRVRRDLKLTQKCDLLKQYD